MIRIIPKNLKCKVLIVPKIFRIQKQNYADGFTYLLPDEPLDNATNNYLMNIPKQKELINFSKIDPKSTFRAFLKSLLELESSLEEISKIDENNLNKLTFDDLFEDLNKKLVQLNYCWSIFELMFILKPNNFTLRKKGNAECTNAFNSLKEKLYSHETLFKIMCIFEENSEKLTEQQQALIKKFILKGKLNGLDSNKKEKIKSSLDALKDFKNKYIENVNKANSAYSHKIANKNYIKTLPNYLTNLIEDESRVNIYLNPIIYQHFLANCDDEMERYSYWYAYNNRSSLITNRKIANNLNIDEIISKRRYLSKYFNFLNYIEYSLQTGTFDSIVAIKNFIEKLFEQTRSKFEEDINELINFAITFPDYKSKTFNLWDVSFFLNQYKQKDLAMMNVDTNLYFPIDKVFDGVFKFMEDNLNLSFEKVNLKKENKLFDDTTEYYHVYRNNELIGSFYLNLYSKAQFPQIRSLTEHCDSLNVKPIGLILLNYQKPVEGQKLTLSYLELIRIFKSFGYMLDLILPNNKYAEISGFSSLNDDYKNLTANFLSLFAIHDYEVVKNCTQNISTGEVLSKEIFEKLKNNFLKFHSIGLTEEIYKSALDFALYTQRETWIDIQRAVYNKYMYPFVFGKENFHLCSAIDIICSKPGSYYNETFSKVIAADLFSTLNCDPENKDSRSKVLNLYVNKFLLKKDIKDDSEIFKAFKGRDFSIKPFLNLNQVNKSQ